MSKSLESLMRHRYPDTPRLDRATNCIFAVVGLVVVFGFILTLIIGA